MNKDPSFLAITFAHCDDILDVANGKEMTESLYLAMFEYYTANDEMPYAVAKGRGGDPYEWITEKLATEFSGLFND